MIWLFRIVHTIRNAREEEGRRAFSQQTQSKKGAIESKHALQTNHVQARQGKTRRRCLSAKGANG